MLNCEAISRLCPFLLKFDFTRWNKKPAEIDVKEIYQKVWLQHLKLPRISFFSFVFDLWRRCAMQEAIVVQIKFGWSYWSSLGRLTVPQFRVTQEDGFNRQTKGCQMILMKKVETHTISGSTIQVMNIHAWQFIT